MRLSKRFAFSSKHWDNARGHRDGTKRARRGKRPVASSIQPAIVHCRIELLEDRLLLAANPMITAPAAATVNENAALTFSNATNNAISLTDAAATGTSDNLSLGVTHGTLTFASTSSLTFINGTRNGSPGVNVRGTLAALNAALSAPNGLTYQPAPGFSRSDSLKISLFDSGDKLMGSATVAITVDAPPKLTVPAPATVIENGKLSFSAAANDGILVTDTAEFNGNFDSLTLNVGHGTLTLGSTTNLVFTAGGNGTSSMTFEQTPANLRAALDGLVYQPASGYSGLDALTISVKNPIDMQTASKSVTIYVNTWTGITAASLASENNAEAQGADFELLLPNGDLMVHGGNVGPTTTWYEIKPDSTGSYANGTWSQLASMNVARLFFSADVLPNGDVFVFGGEYASDGQVTTANGAQYSDSAEIFTPPSANNLVGTWTMVAPDPHVYTNLKILNMTFPSISLGGDQPSEVLSVELANATARSSR
jgi:hypothetical protein